MLKASERLSDNYLLANAHIKLGEIQNQEEHHEKVLWHYKQALQYAEGKEVIDLNNKSIQKDILLDVNIKLTNYYLDRNNPEEAFIYLLRVNINLSFVEFDTSIPIIALTASEIDEVQENLAAIGLNDIITKPFNEVAFFKKIGKNINKSKTDFGRSGNLTKVS